MPRAHRCDARQLEVVCAADDEGKFLRACKGLLRQANAACWLTLGLRAPEAIHCPHGSVVDVLRVLQKLGYSQPQGHRAHRAAMPC